MTDQTEALIARLEAMHGAATQGEWVITPGANSHCFDLRIDVGTECIAFVEGDTGDQDDDGNYPLVVPSADATSIAALHNAAPQLFATIREQAAEIERLTAYAAKLEEGIRAADLLCDATSRLVASVEARKALGEQP